MPDACRNCPICDLAPESSDCLAQFDVNHHNQKNLERQSYELTYCACGELVYLSPLPSHRDILAMYAETDQFGGDNPTSSVYRGERAATVLEYITTCLTSLMRVMGMDLQSRMSVLEVGAGLSWMCRAAKMMDWGHLTVAQDLSAETIEECRWVDHYLVEDLLSEQGVDEYGPYDVISMTHVFEHLADPVAMLRRLRGLLSERGVIFITAPSHPADWQRGADQEIWARWSYNHVPAHLQYFTSGSFAKAAEAAGLEVALWNDKCDGGEAFEGWLRHPSTG